MVDQKLTTSQQRASVAKKANGSLWGTAQSTGSRVREVLPALLCTGETPFGALGSQFRAENCWKEPHGGWRAAWGLEPLLMGTGWEYRGCAPGKGKAEGGI